MGWNHQLDNNLCEIFFFLRHSHSIEIPACGSKPQRGAIRILSGKVINIDIYQADGSNLQFFEIGWQPQRFMMKCETFHNIYIFE